MSKTNTNIKWVFIESISLKASTFVLSILLARLLLPSDFGTLAIINVFYLIATLLAQSGFNEALIQKKEATDVDYSTMFWSNLGLSIFLYLILFFTAPLIEHYYDIVNLSSYIRLQSLTLIIDAFSFVQIVKATKDLNLKQITVSRIPATIISFIIGILLAYFGFGIKALIFQQILNILIYTVLLSLKVRYKIQFVFSWTSFKELLNFGIKILSITFLSRVQAQLTNLSFASFYGTKELGLYTRSKSLQAVPTDIFNTTYSKGIYPTLVKIKEKNYMLRKYIKANLRFLLFISFFINFIFFYQSANIVHVLFGDNWLPMIIYIKVIIFGTLLEPINSQMMNVYKSKGILNNLLKFESYFKFTILVMVFVLPYWFDFIVVIGLLALLNTIYSLLFLYNGSKLIKMSFSEELQFMIVMFLYFIFSGFLINLFVGSFSAFFSAFLQLSFFLIIYFINAVVFSLFFKELNITKIILKKN